MRTLRLRMIIIIKTILVQFVGYIGRPGKFDKPVNFAKPHHLVVFFVLLVVSVPTQTRFDTLR